VRLFFSFKNCLCLSRHLRPAAPLRPESETFEALKRQEITDKDAHDLTIRLFDAGAIGVLEIPRIIKEWREPRHAQFAEAGKSAWRLFNAATEIIKGDLWRLPARTRTIHQVLDDTLRLESDGSGDKPYEPETVELAA
jgi:hypothetical protein